MSKRITLIDWLVANPTTAYATGLRKLPKAVEVRSIAPDLWHLDDYEVVLPLAGESVLMQPRREE